MDFSGIINRAKLDRDRPSTEDLAQALLVGEKTKTQYELKDLMGEWQLIFLLAKKQTKGFYLPKILSIAIAYHENRRVKNTLALGVVKMVVTGPIAFYERKNIMAFDFTHLELYVLGVKIYGGYIRQGEKREERFPRLTVAHQAFFKYFYCSEDAIAARGRGGGLAVWVKK